MHAAVAAAGADLLVRQWQEAQVLAQLPDDAAEPATASTSSASV